jgi:hypothetical protein
LSHVLFGFSLASKAYVKVLSQLSFLRPMLKFSVQIFYQPLFRHSFPFNNFPLAILFPSKSFPHQKAKSKSPKRKTYAKAQSKSQRQKAKASSPPSAGLL